MKVEPGKKGVKLTVEQVHYVRENWARQSRRTWIKVAKSWGMNLISLRRIALGYTWKTLDDQPTPLATKRCKLCETYIPTKWPSGVNKWASAYKRQEYCSHHCACKGKWKSGIYTHIPGKKKDAPCGEREGNLRPSSEHTGDLQTGEDNP